MKSYAIMQRVGGVKQKKKEKGREEKRRSRRKGRWQVRVGASASCLGLSDSWRRVGSGGGSRRSSSRGVVVGGDEGGKHAKLIERASQSCEKLLSGAREG